MKHANTTALRNSLDKTKENFERKRKWVVTTQVDQNEPTINRPLTRWSSEAFYTFLQVKRLPVFVQTPHVAFVRELFSIVSRLVFSFVNYAGFFACDIDRYLTVVVNNGREKRKISAQKTNLITINSTPQTIAELYSLYWSLCV